MTIWHKSVRGLLKLATIVALIAIALLMSTFALPIPLWRTGERSLPPLAYQTTAPPSSDAAVGRIWIDADTACGTGRRRDPDDCLAMLALLRARSTSSGHTSPGASNHAIVGVSTVFGNAPLAETDPVARELIGRLDAVRRPPVYAGCAAPLHECMAGATPAAVNTLAAALREAPLRLVALGPLTNLAAVLTAEPALARQVTEVIAVMGRRPGHLFHPAEGRGDGAMLFGHGPVFRDLNAVLDLAAVSTVLEAGVALTLLPYTAAREVLLQAADLDWIATQGDAGAWVAARSRTWLDYWRQDIGIDGFYPFDLLVPAYLQQPAAFRCARVTAWVGRDPLLPLFPRTPALMVTQDEDAPAGATAIGRAIYCDRVRMDARTAFKPID